MSFPGTCDRCKGPVHWALDSDDQVWIHCDDPRCLDDQMVLPLVSEEIVETPEGWFLEPMGEREVVPCEGGAARVNETEVEWPGDPPQAFLNSLWEGYRG